MPRRISDDMIAQICDENDIIDYVSRYVQLKKSGRDYSGLCPFHHEKTPSFHVSQEKQLFHCFGCGASGNLVQFVMRTENLDFIDALKLLADNAGIIIPEDDGNFSDASHEKKKRILAMNKLSARFFYNCLRDKNIGEKGQKYFAKRNIPWKTVTVYGLGYAPEGHDHLLKYLTSQGFKTEEIVEGGLAVSREGRIYDKFRDRVMFPIIDVRGNVIGFGGRIMHDNKEINGYKIPKYLNSPETPVFDKGRNLFSLNLAKNAKSSEIILCEGYMDVISMHQAGFTNAVASLGTAFTSQHAMLLKRYTDQVVLTYDSDGAGVKAALRAIPILKEVGMSIKVLNMKPYKDPDEFIKNLGKEEFQKRIDNAVGSFMFEISVIRSQYNMQDPESKTGFYNAIAKKLLEFPEKLERDNYTEAVAREYMIPETDLKNLVNSMGGLIGVTTREREYDKERTRQKKEKEDGIRKSQRLLLTWLIERPQLFEKIRGIITPEDFDDELYREAASMVFDEYEKTGSVNPAQILNHFIEGEEQYREVAALFHASLSESLNNEEQRRALSETVKKIKKHSLEVKGKTADIRELQEIIRQQSALSVLNITLD